MYNGLGNVTANVNEFFSPGRFGTPAVGDGATLIMWTDTRPYTVTRISDSAKTFWMRECGYKIVSGSEYDGSAEYEYFEIFDNPVLCVRMTKRGWMTGGLLVRIGERRRYYDPSF